MDTAKRPFVENLELRITLRRVSEFFEAVSQLGEPDKGILLQEISRQLREHIPDEPVQPPAIKTVSSENFVDRCRELAEAAPNDRVRDILRKIALAFEVAAAVETASSENFPNAA